MQQPVTPVVQIESTPSEEIGVADVLVGSIAIIGILIVAALLVGLVTGGIFIGLRKWRDAREPDTPEPLATGLNLSSPPSSNDRS